MTEVGMLGATPGIDTSAVKNPLTEYFGPPARPQFGAQDRVPHETWNLSEWADLPGQTLGKSPFMAVTIEALVVDFDEWPTRELMPWVHTDAINVQWSVWKFDHTLADYEPEQAPPRFISSHTEHHTSRLVRRGLAFILEHGFWSTGDGRMAYVENLRCLQSACHETVQQSTINALMSEGKAWEKKWAETHGKAPRSMRDVFEALNWSSFIVNKRPHGWAVLDAYLCKFLSIERVEPNVWVVPPKMKLFASIVPEAETEYYRRGPRAGVNIEYGESVHTTFRGKKVFETRDVPTDVDADPINALRRHKVIGDWHLSGPHWPAACATSDRCRAYTSHDASVGLFNMDTDDFGDIDVHTMLKSCNRFDGNGDLSPMHGNICSGSYEDLNMGDDHDMFITPCGGGYAPVRYLGDISLNHWTAAQRIEAANCLCASLNIPEMGDEEKAGWANLKAYRNPAFGDADVLKDNEPAGKTVAWLYVNEMGNVKKFVDWVHANLGTTLPADFGTLLSHHEKNEIKKSTTTTKLGDTKHGIVAFVSHALTRWYPSLKKQASTNDAKAKLIASLSASVISTDEKNKILKAANPGLSASQALDAWPVEMLQQLYAFVTRHHGQINTMTDAQCAALVDGWRRVTFEGGSSEKYGDESDISVSHAWLAHAKAAGVNNIEKFHAVVEGATHIVGGAGDYSHAAASMDGGLARSFADAAKWNAEDVGAGSYEDMELDFQPAGVRWAGHTRDVDPRGTYAGQASSGKDKGKVWDSAYACMTSAMAAIDLITDIKHKLCAARLAFTPVNMGSFTNLLDRNVPLPCKFLLMRPFRVYEAGAGILARGGIGLGANLYGRVNFQFGDNILAKTHVGHLTFYHRSVVRGPKNYVVADSMFCLGYIRGENLTTFERIEQFDAHNARSSDGVDRSVFVYAVPASLRRDQLPNPLDVTGRWHSAMANGWMSTQATADNRAHFSSAAYYDEVWKWGRMREQYENVGEAGRFDEPGRIANTVCFEGMGWHSCPTASKRRFTISSDALGPNVYRGVRAARSGCGEEFREQNYHKHYVPF